MASQKDISSTEKLLNVIRQDSKNSRPGSPPPPGGAAPTVNAGRRLPSFKSREVVGVEIQEKYLNVVRMARSGSEWKAVQAFCASIPDNTRPGSREFEGFLRNQLKGIQGIKKARIWAMIPDSKGEIWHARVPPVKKDIPNAVFWSAKKERGFDENKVVFDYRLQGETTDSGGRKMLAMACTAPREEIDLLQKAFSGAGFSLEGITLSSFAMHNLFVNGWMETGGETFAVLYIDQHNAYIDIHDSTGLLLSRVIKTGLESMLESIFQHQSEAQMPQFRMPDETTPETTGPVPAEMDRKDALDLIHSLESMDSQPTEGREFSPERVMEMIQPALERLLRQVERTMDHSVNVQGNPSPARLYLCGRLAPAGPVPEYFQEQLGLTAEALDPLHPSSPRASALIHSLNRNERVFLAPATGLAISDNAYTPNFLFTAAHREKEKIQKRNGSLAAAAVIAVFLAAGGYWLHLDQELDRARQDTAALQQELAGFSPRITPEMVQSRLDNLEQESEVLKSYSRKFVPVAAMRELSAVTPDNIRLLNVRMEMDGSRDPRDGVLVVEGFIRGEEFRFETFLSSYLHRLRASPLFRGTELSHREAESVGAQEKVLRFVINVDFEQV